ncbi:hypothetical protein D7X33_33620, partial [Butyricicoccus sp. 1XD8-22]
KGITLIELLRKTNIRLLTYPELTALWEKELTAIKKGKSSQKFMEGIQKFAELIVSETKNLHIDSEDFEQSYGQCPKCSKNILASKTRYYCSGHNDTCNFFIWKTQFNKTISPKMMDQLMKKGKTGLLTFTSKEKKPYKARFVLANEVENGRLQLEFENVPKSASKS